MGAAGREGDKKNLAWEAAPRRDEGQARGRGTKMGPKPAASGAADFLDTLKRLRPRRFIHRQHDHVDARYLFRTL